MFSAISRTISNYTHNIAFYILTLAIILPKVAKAVQSHVGVADSFAYKCRQCKWSIIASFQNWLLPALSGLSRIFSLKDFYRNELAYWGLAGMTIIFVFRSGFKIPATTTARNLQFSSTGFISIFIYSCIFFSSNNSCKNLSKSKQQLLKECPASQGFCKEISPDKQTHRETDGKMGRRMERHTLNR